MNEMDEFSSLPNIQALSDLLSLRTAEESDTEACKNVNPRAIMGPGHIAAPSAYRQDKNLVSSAYVKNTKDIWDVDEVTEGTMGLNDLADPRPQPEYEIVFKQRVGVEDFFMDNPFSMCCELMLVRVKLPETQPSDILLDVKDRFVDLRTPKYKLGLHLPHSAHSREATAQFITERSKLEITLPMNRPLPSIIFS